MCRMRMDVETGFSSVKLCIALGVLVDVQSCFSGVASGSKVYVIVDVVVKHRQIERCVPGVQMITEVGFHILLCFQIRVAHLKACAVQAVLR